jgi:cold shock CspA family protein
VRNNKYFGTIKWYDKQKDFGCIQCQEIGDVAFKSFNIQNDVDIELLSKDILVLFSIKKNNKGRYIAENITLDYCQFVIENHPKFDYKIIKILLNYADDTTKQKLDELISKNRKIEIHQIDTTNLDFLETILLNNDSMISANIIKNLAEGIGIIKNDSTYQRAKQLLHYNHSKQIQGTFYYPELSQFLYNKANREFKFKLWFENFVPFCDFEIVKRTFASSDVDLQNQILQRCNADEKGFLVKNELYPIVNTNQRIEVYFEGIQDAILGEIRKAKRSIYVAVAWFTNHNFLNVLCDKVEEGVRVEIIILNDYINNWIEGLDFQKFIDLGKEKNNSIFYFCGIDNIMHHKFCIIDDNTLFNGSYNWTYYAEHRNYENCIMFKDNPLLIEKFLCEFIRLKSILSPLETIIPFDRDSLIISDFFSAKQYRSKDIEYQAREARRNNNIGLTSKLIQLSLQINPENEEALKFQNEVYHIDEENIRKIAIDQELKEKQRKREELQEQIAKGKRQEEMRLLEEKECKEKEEKENIERLKREKEQCAKQEEERQRLIQQEETLKAKRQLEEKEKIQLIEIEQQKKLLEEQRIKEQRERESTEQEKIVEQKRIEQERKRQAEIIAQKEAEQKKIEEDAKLLEIAKNTKLQGKRGKLRINLQWETYDDLDLHVYDPDNNHIFYSSKQATCQNLLGQLDVDANAGSGQTKTPQENIFWDSGVPEGNYKIEVNHYCYRELKECPFIVTIIPEFGQSRVFSGRVNGEKSTVTVATFSYDKINGLKILTSL